MWLAVGIIGGVGLCSWLPWLVLVVVVVVALALRAYWLALGLLLGFCAISLHPLTPSASDLAGQAGHRISVSGQVVGYPEQTADRTKFVLRAASPHSGQVLVSSHTSVQPGDRVEVTGQLMRPPVFSNFDYRRYLASRGIHSTITQAGVRITGHHVNLARLGYQTRQVLLEQLGRYYTDPSRGFLEGILLGQRSHISQEQTTAFQRTGTSHVLALSGYNISIICMVLLAIFGRQRWALGLAGVGLLAFVIIVGPSASVLRAAVMGGLLLLAQVLGRPAESIILALVAGAGMLLLAPWSLRYDIGFQLSFLATIGILIWQPLLRDRLPRGFPRWLREALSVTLAASLPTLPVIVATFGTISLVAPLANLLVVPVIPWLMLGGSVTLVASLVSPALAAVIATPTAWAADRLLQVVGMLAGLPVAAVTTTEHRTSVALLVTAGVFAVLWWLVSARTRAVAHPKTVRVESR